MIRQHALYALLAPLAVVPALAADSPHWQAQREALVRDVEHEVRAMGDLTGKRELSPLVVESLRTVLRHEFVPVQYRDNSYLNRALPIGSGQTISQPTVVALMTEFADVNESSVVLEIGTGSGYQAAVLAEIVDRVYTIEIVEALGRRAAATLERLDYDNVSVRIGDGYKGWPEHAPFDAIVVTAAPETVPEPLLEQLAIGGKLVIPVGPEYGVQKLQVLEKKSGGTISTMDIIEVRFVPFTRDE